MLSCTKQIRERTSYLIAELFNESTDEEVNNVKDCVSAPCRFWRGRLAVSLE